MCLGAASQLIRIRITQHSEFYPVVGRDGGQEDFGLWKPVARKPRNLLVKVVGDSASTEGFRPSFCRYYLSSKVQPKSCDECYGMQVQIVHVGAGDEQIARGKHMNFRLVHS